MKCISIRYNPKPPQIGIPSPAFLETEEDKNKRRLKTDFLEELIKLADKEIIKKGDKK